MDQLELAIWNAPPHIVILSEVIAFARESNYAVEGPAFLCDSVPLL
jgi:hypothetical protein